MKKLFYLILFSGLFSTLYVTAQETVTNTRDNEKYVVIEELAGTWCQWCPRGQIEGRQLSHDYENIIFVAIHSSDPMEYDEYVQACGLTGAPTGNVNRVYLGAGTGQWESYALQAMAIDPPAYIEVTTVYDEESRELEATISAEFVESLSGNYRLGGLIIEDGVTGPSPGYDQSNAYSGGGVPMGGFEDLPSPVPASMIAYDYVARQLLGGYEGEEGSLPAIINAGETHSYTFTVIIPEEYDPEYIRVAAWLIDQGTGNILNAAKSLYLPGFDNGKPQFVSTPQTDGFVGTEYTYNIFAADPEDDDLNISATDIPDWMTFEQSYQNMVHTAGVLSGTPIESGIYSITLSLTDGNWIIDQTFELVIEESQAAAWEVIGEEGFSSFSPCQTITKISPDGSPYVAYRYYWQPIDVMKFDGSEWVSIGSPGEPWANMDMALDLNGNPWVVYDNINNGKKAVMKKFNGTEWVAVGNPISVGTANSIGMAFDHDGVPYVAFYEQDLGQVGYVYKFDGFGWIMVGDGPISESALFLKPAFDSENTPYLMWCLYQDGYFTRVSKFENNEWSILGGGSITTNSTWFRQNILFDFEDNLFVSLCETGDLDLNVYQFNGSGWNEITEGYDITGEWHGLTHDSDGNLFLGFENATQANQTSVIKYDGSTWTSVGPITISGLASHQSMAMSPDNIPYISYVDQDNESKVTTKAYMSTGGVTQNIELTEGYKFISSRIESENPDMLVVLSDILNENLDFVRNSQGDMLRKIGPNWVNGIGDWITTEGYLFKMLGDETLELTGEEVNPITPIDLFVGYQFVSYLPSESIDAIVVFENILSNDLDFIRDSQGDMLRKIGPNWVNGIGNANPSEGYLIKMLADGELIYNTPVKSVLSKINNRISEHFAFEGGNAADPVYTMYISGLDIGDEVAAYDGDKLVGSTYISSENNFENDLAIFSTLNNGKGFTSGNPITLKVWSKNEIINADFSLEVVFDSYVSDVYPDEDGEYSLVNFKNENSMVNTNIILYPNPATDEINISSTETIKNIMILNYKGQLIYEGNSSRISTSNFKCGIYIIRIKTDNGVETQKFTIK